jgi:hypothetical protein
MLVILLLILQLQFPESFGSPSQSDGHCQQYGQQRNARHDCPEAPGSQAPSDFDAADKADGEQQDARSEDVERAEL